MNTIKGANESMLQVEFLIGDVNLEPGLAGRQAGNLHHVNLQLFRVCSTPHSKRVDLIESFCSLDTNSDNTRRSQFILMWQVLCVLLFKSVDA